MAATEKHSKGRYQLIFSFLLIIALFLSFGLITIRSQAILGNFTRTIYNHPLVVSNAAITAALNITKMHRTMKDLVLSETPEERSAARRSVADSEKMVFHQLDLISSHILGVQGRELERETRKAFEEWRPIRSRVKEKIRAGDYKGAILITRTTGDRHVQKLESLMMKLTAYARNKADGFLDAAVKSQKNLERVTIFLALTGTILSIIIAFVAVLLFARAERELQEKNEKLQTTLNEIKTLRGIIPICSVCKKIRNEEGLWNQLEDYIHTHSEAEFSHGICPSCARTFYAEIDSEPGGK